MAEEERSLIDNLRQRAEVRSKYATRPDLHPGMVKMWTASVLSPLKKLFGGDSLVFTTWPTDNTPFPDDRARETLLERIARLDLLIQSVCNAGERSIPLTYHHVPDIA